jgi:hypothetical protein
MPVVRNIVMLLTLGADLHITPVTTRLEDHQSSWPTEGFVKLLRGILSSGKQVHYPASPCFLGCPLCARHVGPTLESFPHLLTVC